jgi:hypothetical protein
MFRIVSKNGSLTDQAHLAGGDAQLIESRLFARLTTAGRQLLDQLAWKAGGDGVAAEVAGRQ